MMKAERFDYFRRRMADRADIAVGLASIAPSPFLFTGGHRERQRLWLILAGGC
jgi:hypothetical protein